MGKSLTQPKSLLPAINGGLNKGQISLLVQKSIEKVMEDGNVFQLAEVMTVMDEYIKGFRKNEKFVNYLRDELIKNGGSVSTQVGAKIELCEVGVSYDYSNDLRWLGLEEEINKLSEIKKALEERLRRIPAGKTIVDNETGEAFIGPPKSSKSSYKVTLSKG